MPPADAPPPPPGNATPSTDYNPAEPPARGKPKAGDPGKIEDVALAEVLGKKPPSSAADNPRSAPKEPQDKPRAASGRAGLDTPEKRAAYVVAERNLLWAGLSKAVIDKMDPADVLAGGETAAQRRATLDRQRSGKGADTRPASSDPHPAHGGRDQDGLPRTGRAQDEPAGTRERPSDPDPLDDLLDDVPPSHEPQTRRPDPDAERFRAEAETARQELHAGRMELALRTVEADFPLLKDPAQQRLIADRMTQLDPGRRALTEGKAALEQLLRQACFIEYGEQLLTQSRAARSEATDRFRDGQPTDSAARSRSKAPLTEDDIADAAASAVIAAGGDEAAARARMRDRLGG